MHAVESLFDLRIFQINKHTCSSTPELEEPDVCVFKLLSLTCMKLFVGIYLQLSPPT